MSPMSLSHFLAALAESGQVTISIDLTESVDAESESTLREMDRVARLNLAGQAPEFIPQAAVWAAQLLHRGCQLLVCRDLDTLVIDQALRAPCPTPRSPATDYSADLALQYLPGLVTMTRQVASGDPLLKALLVLARDWPLSSVGVAGLENLNVESFIADPALRQLYVDRILERE